jgi:DNA-binding MarR family transcriptional regulator
MIGTLTNVARTTPDNPLALDDQVCFALAVAARSVVAVYKPVLEPLGLTHPQYLVMLALWESDELSVRDLSRLLQLDPGTLSPLLKRLELAGYVRRARNPHDERALAVALTPEGRALRKRALDVPPAVVERLGLPLKELTDLQRRLSRVITAATTQP